MKHFISQGAIPPPPPDYSIEVPKDFSMSLKGLLIFLAIGTFAMVVNYFAIKVS